MQPQRWSEFKGRSSDYTGLIGREWLRGIKTERSGIVQVRLQNGRVRNAIDGRHQDQDAQEAPKYPLYI